MPRRKQFRINRERLAKEVSKRTGIEEWFIRLVHIYLFNLIQADLAEGNRVNLQDFGTFAPTRWNSKPAQRFFTPDGLQSETMRIPAHYVVKFVPCHAWKNRVLREFPLTERLAKATVSQKP